MLECSACGTKNTNGASMCITCGSKHLLTEAEVSAKPPEAEPPNEDAPETPPSEDTEDEDTEDSAETPPSESTIEIRRLGRGDGELALEAISQLKAADWDGHGGRPTSLTANYLARFLRYDDHFLIVAIDDAEPAGYLLAYELPRVDRDQNMMLLYEISVAEGARQHGIGAALIDEIRSICRERDIMKMWVQTNEANEAAMRLYETAGGTRAEEDDLVQFGWTSETF